MDYEKKYKEALKKGKVAHKGSQSDREKILAEIGKVKLIIQNNRAQGAFTEGYIIGQESVLEHFDRFMKSIPEEHLSEDERIKKELIQFFSDKDEEDYEGMHPRAQIIAWLEKQKPIIEMKSAEESLGIDSDTYNKIMDECIYGEQKPADKVEPKTTAWKPSDEQLKALKEAYDEHWEPDGLDPLYTLYQDLKKLREE